MYHVVTILFASLPFSYKRDILDDRILDTSELQLRLPVTQPGTLPASSAGWALTSVQHSSGHVPVLDGRERLAAVGSGPGLPGDPTPRPDDPGQPQRTGCSRQNINVSSHAVRDIDAPGRHVPTRGQWTAGTWRPQTAGHCSLSGTARRIRL